MYKTISEISTDLKLTPNHESVILSKSKLKWLPIDKLVINDTYQRKISYRGLKNINNIIKNFNWVQFGVVQVADLKDGRYAIIDGQHRTICANARGIKEVPCNIVQATESEQASAFININKTVIVSPLSSFVASIAAGDKDSIELRDTCKQAGVTISPYPVSSTDIKPGVTLSLGALKRVMRTYGPEHLVMVLRTLVESKEDKNRGLITRDSVLALAHILDVDPDLKNQDKLIEVFSKIDIKDCINKAYISSRQNRRSVSIELSISLMKIIEDLWN